jgi:hypothetical protein
MSRFSQFWNHIKRRSVLASHQEAVSSGIITRDNRYCHFIKRHSVLASNLETVSSDISRISQFCHHIKIRRLSVLASYHETDRSVVISRHSQFWYHIKRRSVLVSLISLQEIIIFGIISRDSQFWNNQETAETKHLQF